MLCLGITFLLGISVEGLAFWRYHLITTTKINEKKKFGVQKYTMVLPMPVIVQVVGTYFFNILLSYALMLVVMSFNVGVLISGIVGLGVGHLIFGLMKMPI